MDSTAADGITQAEYADRRGVTRQAVYKLCRQGKLTRLPNGRIDPIAADRELQELNPARSKAARGLGQVGEEPEKNRVPQGIATSPISAGGMTQQAAMALEFPPPSAAGAGDRAEQAPVAPSAYALNKAERERYAALRERMEYERELKLLVPREPIGRALFEAGRTLRDTLYGAIRNAAPTCAGESDALKVEDLLKREVDAALAAFAKLAESRISRIVDAN